MRDVAVARERSRWVGAAIVLVPLVVLAFAVAKGQSLPTGPEPVAWDRDACAHCRMHVGDPRFAAQLQTLDGAVLQFDDPGCLLRYLAERRPRVHAAYVHAARGEAWLAMRSASFARISPSPMGYDLGAVPVGTPGAITWGEAAREVTRARAQREGSP